ncbi:CU044_5270 family protein [Nonomuraea sp. NPDC050643]|uniref:CU044_5270 family protein n=1 Tax=Nonomuraea sp. NPDC050643 TaxID=3155660 RepID=UPI0033F8BD5E
MDDLRSLRELRAVVPEPGQEWLVPERRRLLRRMRGRRRGLGRALLLAGVLGTATAVAVVVARPQPPITTPVGPSQAVRLDPSVVLARAADTVGRREGAGEVPRPTQWQYTKTLDKQPNRDETQTFERWMRYDGKQTAGFDEAGKPVVRDVPPDPGDDDLSPQQYDQKLRALPTDPKRLLAKVTGDRHWIDWPVEEGVPKVVEPDASRAYRVITLYLSRYGVMPPKLEAAMFRALALIPGIRIEQGIPDAAGRRGLGVWLDNGIDSPFRDYDILDPETYRYLGRHTVWLRDEYSQSGGDLMAAKGSVWTTALLTSTIVDRPGERG